MKGTVVMRCVGNRQEPEDDPNPLNPILFVDDLSLFVDDLRKLNEEFERDWNDWMKRVVASLRIGVIP